MFKVLSVHTMTVNWSIQAEELGNKARELRGLIDDSESVIFINLDRYTHTDYKMYKWSSHFKVEHAVTFNKPHCNFLVNIFHCSEWLFIRVVLCNLQDLVWSCFDVIVAYNVFRVSFLCSEERIQRKCSKQISSIVWQQQSGVHMIIENTLLLLFLIFRLV